MAPHLDNSPIFWPWVRCRHKYPLSCAFSEILGGSKPDFAPSGWALRVLLPLSAPTADPPLPRPPGVPLFLNSGRLTSISAFWCSLGDLNGYKNSRSAKIVARQCFAVEVLCPRLAHCDCCSVFVVCPWFDTLCGEKLNLFICLIHIMFKSSEKFLCFIMNFLCCFWTFPDFCFFN